MTLLDNRLFSDKYLNRSITDILPGMKWISITHCDAFIKVLRQA